MSQVATSPSMTASSNAVRSWPPTTRVHTQALVSASCTFGWLPRSAQLLEHGRAQIGEVALREPLARRAVNDRAQRGVDGVGRSSGTEHGCRCVDEFGVEVDVRASDRGFAHLTKHTPVSYTH